MRLLRARIPLFPFSKTVASWLAVILLLGARHVNAQPSANALQQQVLATERAFAKSMADRDVKAFARYVADEAVFLDGSTALRGKAQVISRWSRLFEGKAAPFSWEPDQVEVLDSGTLALSTGPVRNPEGKVIARFNSIWRLEADGVWRVVFDKGGPPNTADNQ
jgi:ketosteroid isomerase-like protein